MILKRQFIRRSTVTWLELLYKGVVQCSLLILCETVSQYSKNVRTDVSWACFWKLINVGAERMSSGRLFRATGPAKMPGRRVVALFWVRTNLVRQWLEPVLKRILFLFYLFIFNGKLEIHDTMTRIQRNKDNNIHTGWPQKSKPLPNDQKIALNRIKACQWE